MNRIISITIAIVAFFVTTSINAANYYGPEFEKYFKEQIVGNITNCDTYIERYARDEDCWESTPHEVDSDFSGERLEVNFEADLEPGDYRIFFSMKSEEGQEILWISSEVIQVKLGTTNILFTKDDLRYRINSNPYIIFQLDGSKSQDKIVIGENVAYPVYENGEFDGKWEVRVDNIWEVDKLAIFSSKLGHATINKPENWYSTIDLSEICFDGNLSPCTINVLFLTQSEYKSTFKVEELGNSGEEWIMLSVQNEEVQDYVLDGNSVEFLIEVYDLKTYWEWYEDQDGNWEYNDWETRRRYGTMEGKMSDIVTTFELPFDIKENTYSFRIHYILDGKVYWQWMYNNNYNY